MERQKSVAEFYAPSSVNFIMLQDVSSLNDAPKAPPMLLNGFNHIISL